MNERNKNLKMTSERVVTIDVVMEGDRRGEFPMRRNRERVGYDDERGPREMVKGGGEWRRKVERPDK